MARFGHRRYELVTLSAFLGCIGSALLLGPLSKVQDGYVPVDPRRQSRTYGALEPNIGDAGPAGLARAGEITAIVVLSDCGECSYNAVNGDARLSRIDRLIFLAPQPEDQGIRALAAQQHAEMATSSDGLIRKLDAYFAPRLYVYGQDQKRAYIQASSRDWKTVVEEFNAAH